MRKVLELNELHAAYVNLLGETINTVNNDAEILP
jgi:hypothetical protein